MKRIVFIILTLILLFPHNLFALEFSDLDSEKVLIYNKDEDKILYEKNIDEVTSIASLTKMMTTLVSIEKIKDLEKEVTITKEMLEDVPWDASTAGLEVGDILTYEDLLYASMLPSGADATNSLAISLTGSIDNFVEEMNKKAKELKLEKTHFVNTTGYDETGHYSTAREILTILNYALENETFKEIFTTRNYTTNNGLKLEATIESYNKRLNNDLSYIIGSKTGYTDDAGQCLVALSNIDDTNIITITINAPYSYERPGNIIDMTKLYETLKEKYTKVNIITEDQILISLETKYAKEDTIDLNSQKNIPIYIEKPFNEDLLEIKYEGEEIIKSSTAKGTEVGKIKIYYDGELIEELPGITSSNLNFSIIKYLKENIILYISLIILLIIGLKIIKKPKKKLTNRI